MQNLNYKVELMPHLSYKDAVFNVCTASCFCYGIDVPETLEEQEAKIRARMSANHESVIEHAYLTFKITTDRGVTHELVRHRPASFTEQSTRYCNSAKGLNLLIPDLSEEIFDEVWTHFEETERLYQKMTEMKIPRDVVRDILPTCTSANIMMTGNVRQLRHMINLRYFGTTGKPHPKIKKVFETVYYLANKAYPVFFENLGK